MTRIVAGPPNPPAGTGVASLEGRLDTLDGHRPAGRAPSVPIGAAPLATGRPPTGAPTRHCTEMQRTAPREFCGSTFAAVSSAWYSTT